MLTRLIQLEHQTGALTRPTAINVVSRDASLRAIFPAVFSPADAGLGDAIARRMPMDELCKVVESLAPEDRELIRFIDETLPSDIDAQDWYANPVSIMRVYLHELSLRLAEDEFPTSEFVIQ